MATEFNKYFKDNYRHPGYPYTVALEDHLKFHFDRYVPPPYAPVAAIHDIILAQRPTESKDWKQWRIRNFKNGKQRKATSKACTTLKKIFRADDWSISFSDETHSKIKVDESFSDYTKEKYPFFGSVEYWCSNELTDAALKDPNSKVVVIPIDKNEQSDNDYDKPYGFVIRSTDVWDYKDKELAFVQSPYTHEVPDGNTKRLEPIFWAFDKDQIHEIIEVKENNSHFQILRTITHNLGVLPVYDVPSIPNGFVGNYLLRKSFLDPMIDSLDECAREYSDLQAAKVQHLHPKMWMLRTQVCTDCRGTGVIAGENGPSSCGTCGGSGTPPLGPTQVFEYKVGDNMEKDLPAPPAGYIEQNTQIIELQSKQIEMHVYDALASVNMEFLADTPLNQSGKAKEVDKDEINTFGYAWAEAVVNYLEWHYKILGEYRHKGSLSSEKDRKAELPTIAVPRKFDFFSSMNNAEERKASKEAGVAPEILKQMDIELAKKKFARNPEAKERAICAIELQPFPQFTVDDMIGLNGTSAITDIDYIISCNLKQLIDEAFDNDPMFFGKTNQEKKATIKLLAEAKKKDLDVLPPVEIVEPK